MNIDLINSLKLWNGVQTEYLIQLYRENYLNPVFFDDLATIYVKEKDLQKTTTWLIKHHYDNGHILPDSLTEKLLAVCKDVENWEAKLHLLQLLSKFKLTKKSIITVEDFVRKCLADDNKFVRAWAYHGLYELTKYIPEMKLEVELLCQRAMETESAAIKSKVRKIISALNKKKN